MTAAARTRGLAPLLVAAVLAASFAACSSDDEEAAPLPEVRFAFLQAIDLAAYLVMRDQGFDRENGFTLVEEELAGGKAALEAMVAGTIDVAYTGSVQIFAAARAGDVPGRFLPVGANTRVDAEHPAMAVLVGPDVDDWRDLDGKALAVNQVGSLAEVSARIRLHAEGVTDFRFVEIAFANQGLALAGGDVAAAVMSEPFLTQSILRGDGAVLDWVIGGRPFPVFPYTFIVARGQFARDEPDLVQGFLRAQLDAVQWIAAHEPETRTLVATRLALDDRVAEEMLMNPYVTDARFDADLVAKVQATLAADDPSATPVPAADLFDETLLLEVLDGAG